MLFSTDFHTSISSIRLTTTSIFYNLSLAVFMHWRVLISKFPMRNFSIVFSLLVNAKVENVKNLSQIHAQIFVLKILFQKLDKCFLVYKQNKVKHSLHSQNKLWRISIKNHFHVFEMPKKLNLYYFNNLMYSSVDVFIFSRTCRLKSGSVLRG